MNTTGIERGEEAGESNSKGRSPFDKVENNYGDYNERKISPINPLMDTL